LGIRIESGNSPVPVVSATIHIPHGQAGYSQYSTAGPGPRRTAVKPHHPARRLSYAIDLYEVYVDFPRTV
jgi:hypothetical protein